MAGLSKRFCRQACSGDPPERKPDYKGLCGLCSGKCQPCDEDGNNCGDWQDCECSAAGTGACGDGHNCDRYIDIEFSLDSFIIQGKVCTNANGLNITQQCDGGQSELFNEIPVTGNPSGWSAKSDGESNFVRYEKRLQPRWIPMYQRTMRPNRHRRFSKHTEKTLHQTRNEHP